MKKIKIPLCFFLISLFAACCFRDALGMQASEPYGIWHSESPNLTLYIDPEVEKSITEDYMGIYVHGGIEEECVFLIDMSKGGKLLVMPLPSAEDLSHNTYSEETYFDGYVVIKNNKMIYTLLEYVQKRTGYKEIVFEKTGDYPLSGSS